MGKYLNLQNKALHKGLYLAYVELPQSRVPYTTNGHLMVRGKVAETSVLKTQDDLRNQDPIALTDKRWLSDLKDLQPTELEVELEDEVTAGDQKYSPLYVEYVMARYQVADWKRGGKNLVAVDTGDKIIAIIAPLKEKMNG